MQPQTMTPRSNRVPHQFRRRSRLLALAGALVLVFGMTACGEEEAAVEGGQTPAGQEGEETTASGTVSEGNVQVEKPEPSAGNTQPEGDAQEPLSGKEGASTMESASEAMPPPEESGAPPEESTPPEEEGVSPDEPASPPEGGESSEKRVSPEELNQ